MLNLIICNMNSEVLNINIGDSDPGFPGVIFFPKYALYYHFFGENWKVKNIKRVPCDATLGPPRRGVPCYQF